jgi:hypothetical protein
MPPIVRVQRRPPEVPGGGRQDPLPPLATTGATGDPPDPDAEDPPESSARKPDDAPARSDQPESPSVQAAAHLAEPAASRQDPTRPSTPVSAIQRWFGTSPSAHTPQGGAGIEQVWRTSRSRPAVQGSAAEPRETVRPLSVASGQLVSLAPLVHVQPVVQRLPSEAAGWHLEPSRAPAGAVAEPGPAEAAPVRELPVARLAGVRAPRATTTASPHWPEVSGAPVQPLLHLQAPSPAVSPQPVQLSHSRPSPQGGAIAGPEAPAALTISRQAEGAQSAAQVVAGGGAAHDAGAGARSETELDELAGRLYDRFRSRLRMELLVSRERAGLATDLK